MNDAAVRQLARRAGIATEWTDYANKRHRVPLDSVRRILAALGLPCACAADLSHSQHLLGRAQTSPLVTVTAGEAAHLTIRAAGDRPRARLIHEDGSIAELALRRAAHGIGVPALHAIGYHTLEIGQRRITLAVAPPRCTTIEDIAPGERVAGLAAQTYGLRSAGDCGIGDMTGVTALARAAAAIGIDALALSPAHAVLMADRFSPYSPSSRLFYNPLLADTSSAFGEARVGRARTAAALGTSAREFEASSLIDWPASGRAKLATLCCLFDDFVATDLAAGTTTTLAADFASFRAAHGAALRKHALFEALHQARLRADPHAWNWREWPAKWRDPNSAAVKGFAEDHEREVLFHTFLQWVADRSFASAQRQAEHAGMRIGLISDLAIGMNRSGSDAWTSSDDILGGLQIGAPPDLFSPNGQNWGLTTFSPLALREGGFGQFIATLRACMRHAGGVRIDHVMGFMRLWVTPIGANASEGAYLAYPLDDMFRLTVLESHRHRSIVVGEDLGTVPVGFPDRLAQAGIYGTSVLWFERVRDAFAAPSAWAAEVVAMTSTHDLPTVAGWWSGNDLEMRHRCGLVADRAGELATRSKERRTLWRAFQSAKIVDGDMPALNDGPRLADAAVKFIAATPSRLALLPLEDALANADQPNLPGTIDEHPNWRRRYAGEAGALLDSPVARHRVEVLAKRDAS